MSNNNLSIQIDETFGLSFVNTLNLRRQAYIFQVRNNSNFGSSSAQKLKNVFLLKKKKILCLGQKGKVCHS